MHLPLTRNSDENPPKITAGLVSLQTGVIKYSLSRTKTILELKPRPSDQNHTLKISSVKVEHHSLVTRCVTLPPDVEQVTKHI